MNFQLKQIVKIAMQNVFLPVIYRIGTVRKVDQKLMIFADFHKDEVPYSMEDLYEWALLHFRTRVYGEIYAHVRPGRICIYL